MRKLVIMRGLPGSGKTTFIRNAKLEPWTLSLDDFRKKLMTCQRNFDGYLVAPMSAKEPVPYDIFYQVLEYRMQCGAFTVIDATNLRKSNINQYINMAKKYRYSVMVVDFTLSVSVEDASYRNAERNIYERVPQEVFDRFTSYLNDKKNKLPGSIQVIEPSIKKLNEYVSFNPIDLSEYKKIYVLGDIHGCYSCLTDFFKKYPYADNNCYIFLGDYLERGIENVETLKFIMDLSQRKNVICLFGNHERYLWAWANDNHVNHEEKFARDVAPLLEQEKISKKEVRKFLRKTIDCAYFTYHDKTYICTHAGIDFIPKVFDMSEQFYCNIGKYSEVYKMDERFDIVGKHYNGKLVSIHGHANPDLKDIKINDSVYNLEGHIEFGGNLRVIELSFEDNNVIERVIEIPNAVYKKTEYDPDSVSNTVEALRNSATIKEKEFGNISSFNFTKEAFQKGIWNGTTMKARGLFIDTKANKVAARSYNKFFNIDEMPESEMTTLKDTLKFPATAYIKENGFLGLLSYNHETDELLFATKSSLNGDYGKWFKNIIEHMFHVKQVLKQQLANYLSKSNTTLLFEVIDPVHDPHIIEYPCEKVVLLDEVKNNLSYSNTPYEKLCEIGKTFGFEVKKKTKTFNNFEDFENFVIAVSSREYKDEMTGEYVEGYVLEDTKHFQVKLKSGYYLYWKWIRSIFDSIVKFGRYKSWNELPHDLKAVYKKLLVLKDVLSDKNIIEIRKILDD